MKNIRTTAEQLADLNEIATTALAVSDHALATLAGTMIDLLGITETVESESPESESPESESSESESPESESPESESPESESPGNGTVKDILEFCEETVLPFLRNAFETDVDEQQVADMQQRVEDNWGDYLELLSPAERFQSDTPAWRDEVYAWDQITEDQPESPDAETSDEIRSPSKDDIDSLLSSINDLTAGQEVSPPEISVARNGEDILPTAPPVLPELASSIDDPELLAAYLDDAQHCLSGMETSLLSFESSGQTAEAMGQFCRELHTLKGASGTVELFELATYLHELETYVESVDPTTLDVDTLLAGVDAVGAQLAALTSDDNSDLPAITDIGIPLHEELSPTTEPVVLPADPIAAGGSTTEKHSAPAETYIRLEASRLDRLMDLLAELVMLRNRRDTYVVGLRNLKHEFNGCANRIRIFDQYPSDNVTSAAPAGKSDDARYVTRSLAEVSNDVSELSRSLEEISEPLSSDNALVSHLIGQFRQELIELRRQPIAGLFQRLQRAARNAGRAEDKPIDMEFIGQGTRVERALQERLYEPLLHMVRNAVSHGIEPSEQRAAAGKPETGRITLEAWSDTSTLFFEIRDDGRGLNTEALERRGRELSLLPVGHVNEEQLFKLIFRSGFSTQSDVSEISGRGIGMDVVNTWIRRLRGRINVSSVAGEGTIFRLQIPLRSAIEHAMVVRVGGQLFALPMQSVSGTEVESNVTDGTDDRIECLNELLGLPTNSATGDRRILSLHDSTVRHGSSSETISPDSSDSPRTQARKMRIAVDAVVGVEEVVVRSLPPMLVRHDLFAGVTLSGQAETVLLLDVPRLIDLGQQVATQTSSDSASHTSDAPNARRPESPHILITDDSVTVRRSLARRLSAHGFRTTEVPDGAQALDALRTGDFMSIITDIDMPRMNGLELLSEIRCNSRLQNLPVVVITSRDDQQTLLQLEELQATTVLNKPVTDDTVTRLLQAIAQETALIN